MSSAAITRSYTLEEKELALHTLALAGNNCEKAVQLLQQHSELQAPPAKTLWHWANVSLQDRYEQIRTEVSQHVANRVANQAEEIALAAGDLELDLLTLLKQKRGELDAKDLAGALRNVTTTKSLNIDKVASPIRGRPTVIHADRSADEILRALKALEPGLIIDSTAELITTQQPEEPEGTVPVGDLPA